MCRPGSSNCFSTFVAKIPSIFLRFVGHVCPTLEQVCFSGPLASLRANRLHLRKKIVEGFPNSSYSSSHLFPSLFGLLGHNNFRRRKSCKKGAPTLVYIFFLNLSPSFLRTSGLNSSCFGNGSAGGFLDFFRSKKHVEGYLNSFLVVSQVPPMFFNICPGDFFNPSLHFSSRFRRLFLSCVFEVPPTLFDICLQVPAPLLLICVPSSSGSGIRLSPRFPSPCLHFFVSNCFPALVCICLPSFPNSC